MTPDEKLKERIRFNTELLKLGVITFLGVISYLWSIFSDGTFEVGKFYLINFVHVALFVFAVFFGSSLLYKYKQIKDDIADH